MATDDLRLQLAADIPPQWQNKVDVIRLKRVAEAILGGEGISGAVEVELLVVDDEEIRDLNARYRGQDVPTDVLSFPLQDAVADDFIAPPDQVLRLGDVVISYPRAVEQAEEYQHSPVRELGYLFAHGVLHLLGYDHEDEAERRIMRDKEEAALAAVGLHR